MRVALVLALLSAAACGDDGVQHLPDAPPDAPPGPGAVTLTITLGRAPRPNIEVYFQNADSSLVATARTDANGVATAEMAAGGFVTAVGPFDAPGQSSATLFTYADVKPGDSLRLGGARDPELIDVEVRLPVEPTAGAYLLHTACNFGQYDLSGTGSGSGSSGPGGRIQIPGCPTTDMLVETFDADGFPAKYHYRADVPLSDGAMIDLTAGTYQDLSDVTYTFTHVPDGLASMFSITSLMNATGLALFRPFVVRVEGGTAVTTGKRPAIPGMRQLITSEIITGGLGVQYVDEWGPVGDYSLDLSRDVLLREYTSTPQFDAASHTLSWSTAPTGEAPNVANAQLAFTRSSSGQSWRWLIVGPGASDELVFPVLPGDAQQLNPIDSDSVAYEAVQTSKVPGGYDAYRGVHFGDRITGVYAPASGRVVRQTFEPSLATGFNLRRGGRHSIAE